MFNLKRQTAKQHAFCLLVQIFAYSKYTHDKKMTVSGKIESQGYNVSELM